jgi:hypothetical protein
MKLWVNIMLKKPFFLPTIKIEEIFNEILQTVEPKEKIFYEI